MALLAARWATLLLWANAGLTAGVEFALCTFGADDFNDM
jgi:hypothetical protein